MEIKCLIGCNVNALVSLLGILILPLVGTLVSVNPLRDSLIRALLSFLIEPPSLPIWTCLVSEQHALYRPAPHAHESGCTLEGSGAS